MVDSLYIIDHVLTTPVSAASMHGNQASCSPLCSYVFPVVRLPSTIPSSHRTPSTIENEKNGADWSQIIHLIFSFSSVISWLLFAVDIALMAWLAMRAYKDGMYESLPPAYHSALPRCLFAIMLVCSVVKSPM